MSDPDRRQLMEWLTQQSMELEPQANVGEAMISQYGDERFDPPIPESAYEAWRGPIGQQAQPQMNVEVGEAHSIRDAPQNAGVEIGKAYNIRDAPQDAWAELENNPASEPSERFRRR